MVKLDLTFNTDDVYKYIISHKSNLKYKEGLFVDYIRDPNFTTLEAKIIVFQKNGILFQPIDIFNQINDQINQKYDPSYNFDYYLENVKTGDNLIRIISYSVLPIIKLLGIENFDVSDYIRLCLDINKSMEDNYKEEMEEIDLMHIKHVFENYMISHIVEKNILIEGLFRIDISKNYAKGMVSFYEDLYGHDEVGKIKKLARENCE